MLPRSIEIIGASVGIAIVILGWLARRYPHVGWLQPFDFTRHLSPQQRARRERASNRIVALEMILAAIVIPVAYVLLKVLLFGEFTATGIVVTAALSLTCLAGGISILVRTGASQNS